MNRFRRFFTRLFDPGSGLDLIADERQRQLSAEGFNDEHDDLHWDGSLADAAACYAATDWVYFAHEVEEELGDRRFRNAWPRIGIGWDKRLRRQRSNGGHSNVATPLSRIVRQHRIRELAKAGALIAAEIDRLQRIEVAAQRIDVTALAPQAVHDALLGA